MSEPSRRTLGEVVANEKGLRLRDLLRRRKYPILPDGFDADRMSAGSLLEAVVERRDSHEVARIVALVAPPQSVRGLLYRLLADFGLSPYYPPEVEAEAMAWVQSPGFDDQRLVDLQDVPFVTIDNDDSRDLDQALAIERATPTGYRVDYALADASYFVRPGSALFHEALRRGSSYYLPNVAIPMLPRSLSEGIISLNPDVPRRALVVRMTLDESGQCLNTQVQRALIRSHAKLTYPGVQAFHDELQRSSAPAHPLWGQPFTTSLLLLREVGELRIAAARARDVVSYDRAEVEVTLGGDGDTCFVARARERLDVELWNEQISLLCNMEGARLLAEASDAPHVQAVYRVHPSPTAESRAALERAIAAIIEHQGLAREPGASPWQWRSRVVHGEQGISLADYLDALPRDASSQRVRLAIERLAMNMSQAASFSIVYGPHHGVGAEGYSRISAPMREIVGIFTHKELLERLGDPSEACDNDADEALRLEVVEAGNRSRNVQRELMKRVDKLVIDQLLRQDLALAPADRPWRAGTVVRVRPTRLYLELDTPPIEVKVYCRHLEQTQLTDLVLDEAAVALRNRRTGRQFHLGDELRIRVRSHEEHQERWIFDLMTPTSGRPDSQR